MYEHDNMKRYMRMLGVGLSKYKLYNEYIDYILYQYSPDGFIVYQYAAGVGRLKYGESVICKSSIDSYFYATHVIGGRFKLGENAIMRVPLFKTSYLNYLNFLGMNDVVNELEERYGL